MNYHSPQLEPIDYETDEEIVAKALLHCSRHYNIMMIPMPLRRWYPSRGQAVAAIVKIHGLSMVEASSFIKINKLW